MKLSQKMETNIDQKPAWKKIQLKLISPVAHQQTKILTHQNHNTVKHLHI